MNSAQSTYVKPLPTTDGLTDAFWQAAKEGNLLVQRCQNCQRYQHYPRPHCVHCGSLSVDWHRSNGTGIVHTFTVIHRNDAPGFVDELPYVFAIIELDEGVRMAGNIINVQPESVHIDMPVQATFVQATDELAIPLWEPAAASRA